MDLSDTHRDKKLKQKNWNKNSEQMKSAIRLVFNWLTDQDTRSPIDQLQNCGTKVTPKNRCQ